MRLVLFSDLHLDAVFAWASPEVAARRRQGLRETLVRIVGLADERDADALLCGGDLYEQEQATPDTRAFLREVLGQAARPVYISPGNHDWFGPGSPYVQVDWPANVHIFTGDRLTPVELAEGLTLWGGAHHAPAGTAGFLDDFQVDRGGTNLALFHGSERNGLSREAAGKDPHAPFDARQIPAAGLDHALLGHYHRPRCEARHTYPGNPDPLTFGEDGRRGAVVVDVAGDGTLTRTWERVAVSEVHEVCLKVTGCASMQDVRDRLDRQLAGLGGCVRVTLTGEVDPDVDLDLAVLRDVAHQHDGLVLRNRARVNYDLDEIARESTIRGRFVRDVRAADLDDDDRRRILVTGLRALDGRDDLAVI